MTPFCVAINLERWSELPAFVLDFPPPSGLSACNGSRGSNCRQSGRKTLITLDISSLWRRLGLRMHTSLRSQDRIHDLRPPSSERFSAAFLRPSNVAASPQNGSPRCNDQRLRDSRSSIISSSDEVRRVAPPIIAAVARPIAGGCLTPSRSLHQTEFPQQYSGPGTPEAARVRHISC